MRSITRIGLAVALVVAGVASNLRAQIGVAEIFGDGMVLQRDTDVSVWGSAPPGSEITVVLSTGAPDGTIICKDVARTDDSGRWRATLSTPGAGGGYDLVMFGDGARRRLKDIWVGDVWLCSGQSNMEWPIEQSSDAEATIAAAKQPALRFFQVTNALAAAPAAALPARPLGWQACTPESARRFSAVAYHFARTLQRNLHTAKGETVPIGLIQADWGGTPIEGWTPAPTLREVGGFDDALRAVDTLAQNAPGDAAQLKPSMPGTLFNGMIAPLMPFALRGVIWYQGESNRNDPAAYAKLFPAMIRAWRDGFTASGPRHDRSQIAFHFVQIAPFGYAGDVGQTALLREAQEAALALPATSMVVTLDVGDAGDIHPRDKKTVGERLAAQALRVAYGASETVASGPVATETTVEEGRLRVHFDHADQGLKAGSGGLAGFELAGDDRLFHVAEAVIEGETILLHSAAVAKPAAARYAFSAVPSASLFNGADWPAGPFRSDRWASPKSGWPAPIAAGAVEKTRSSHSTDDAAQPEFSPLFNGRDLSGWVNVNCAPGTFTARDGVIHCTGKPTGLLRTEKMYENYVLELEWRHLSAQGNAGLFIWSDALPARGVPFTRAVEVQVMVGSEGDWYTSDGDIFPIHGAKMTPENGRGGDRAFPTAKRMKPSPEWNHYQVTCENGAVSLAVNGAVVTRGREASPRKGYICLESEGTPIEFRNLRLKELAPAQSPLKPEQIAAAAQGFAPMYTGLDLEGWRSDAPTSHWAPADSTLKYDGQGGDLWTQKSYRDFEMIVDWRLPRAAVETERPLFDTAGNEVKDAAGNARTEKVKDVGDSGIYLRGNSKSQVNIWCWPCGSGEVWGYRTDGAMPAEVRAACTPKSRADRPPGEWNRFVITMKGDRLTVRLNGVVVIENAQLPGVAAEGPIGLQHHGDPIEFANILVREL